ncbi:MAG: hypothetical protein AABX10_01885 [Nanoarchaeota archaeon]
MCTVCGLMEKGEGGIIVERKYTEDNTNRRNPLAHGYTAEGEERMPEARKFEYIQSGNEYVAPIFSFYSSRKETPVEQVREERPSYIESLAA